MARIQEQLSDHIVVLGYGISGSEAVGELIERGTYSTLAPSNRDAWRLLEGSVQLKEPPSSALLELLVDPQTCGPLLLACTIEAAEKLTERGPWVQIGIAAAAAR